MKYYHSRYHSSEAIYLERCKNQYVEPLGFFDKLLYRPRYKHWRVVTYKLTAYAKIFPIFPSTDDRVAPKNITSITGAEAV